MLASAPALATVLSPIHATVFTPPMPALLILTLLLGCSTDEMTTFVSSEPETTYLFEGWNETLLIRAECPNHLDVTS